MTEVVMGKLRCLAVSFTLALLLVTGIRADTAFELELNGFEVTPPNTSQAAGVGTVQALAENKGSLRKGRNSLIILSETNQIKGDRIMPRREPWWPKQQNRQRQLVEQFRSKIGAQPALARPFSSLGTDNWQLATAIISPHGKPIS